MNTASEAAEIQIRPRKWRTLLNVLSLPAAVMLKMGFFFLLAGMVPTMLVSACLRNPRRYTISIIAAFNFAGVFPDLLGIFMQGGTPRAVIDRLMEPSVWASMYGAALLGIAVVWISQPLAMIALEGIYRGRMRHMEHLQRKLEEEWGPEITGRRE